MAGPRHAAHAQPGVGGGGVRRDVLAVGDEDYRSRFRAPRATALAPGGGRGGIDVEGTFIGKGVVSYVCTDCEFLFEMRLDPPIVVSKGIVLAVYLEGGIAGTQRTIDRRLYPSSRVSCS